MGSWTLGQVEVHSELCANVYLGAPTRTKNNKNGYNSRFVKKFSVPFKNLTYGVHLARLRQKIKWITPPCVVPSNLGHVGVLDGKTPAPAAG